MRRCDGVRLWKPDVERDHAGLCPEADEPENEDQARDTAINRGCVRGPIGEKKRAADACEEEKGRDDECGRGMGHHDVYPRRPAHLLSPVVGEDQRERNERHRFPRDQESEGIARDDHAKHRGDEEHVERTAAGQ